MGEIEGLDTHEPLPRRLERHAFDRLIMLSDGVFAIAITLAALEIRPQGAWSDLPTLWSALRMSLFAYLLSFAVIAAYWGAHRDTFARLERVDSPLTILTLAILCAVAILPTSTRLIYEGGALVAFQLYCFSVAAVGMLQAALWGYAAFRPGLMKREVPRVYRIVHAGVTLVVPSFFLTMAWLLGRGVTNGFIYAALAMSAGVAVLRIFVLPRVARARR